MRKWVSSLIFWALYAGITGQESALPVKPDRQIGTPQTVENLSHTFDPSSDKEVLLKVILAKASNEVEDDATKTSDSTASRAGLGRIDQIGRVYRGPAPMSTELLGRYFLYRYNMGDRWSMARVIHPNSIGGNVHVGPGITNAPLLPATRHPISLAASTASPFPAFIPFFAMASILSAIPTAAPPIPITPKNSVATSHCNELPHRWQIGPCSNTKPLS